MTSNILFIVEGEKTEPKFLKRIWNIVKTKEYEVYSYCTNIYVLIESVFVDGKLDENLDIQSLLLEKETDEGEREKLKKKFTDIFMIFDLDPQDNRFSDNKEKLLSMLKNFKDSTGQGKLYINYPSIESYRHISAPDDDCFCELAVDRQDCKCYKKTSK